MSEHWYDGRISESCVDPNPKMFERQDPDNFTCFCLFDFIIYVPSTIFQFYSYGSSWVQPVLSQNKCVLLKDHNVMTPVRLEPADLRSRVKFSTTEPLRSQFYLFHGARMMRIK